MIYNKYVYSIFFRFLKEENALQTFLYNVHCNNIAQLEKRFSKDKISFWIGSGFDWAMSEQKHNFWRKIDYKWITICKDLNIK